jgi:hypothetical protein
MYQAMQLAFLKIIPKTSPGLTVAEIQERVFAYLLEELFRKVLRRVDLEANGILAREKTKPPRLDQFSCRRRRKNCPHVDRQKPSWLQAESPLPFVERHCDNF